MKRLMIGLTIMVFSGLVTTAFAKPGHGFGGPTTSFGMRYDKRYNPRMFEVENMETIRGRVASMERSPRGMKLMVESDSRITRVILDPRLARAAREHIERNDRVEISGRRVMRGGQSALIAKKISVQEDEGMVTLRPTERHFRRPARAIAY